jgi:type I restriction enzyme, R subunit
LVHTVSRPIITSRALRPERKHMVSTPEPAWVDEAERQTRLRRIDPRLELAGWRVVDFDAAHPASNYTRHAVREYPTANGPADYALWVNGQPLGIVEAKRLAVGPQNVLTQAERYSKGFQGGPFDFDGYHAPFLFSSNGEVIWFHDIRHGLNRSRRLAGFHTPEALVELLGRDLDEASRRLAALPNDHAWLRPYQVEANVAVEAALQARKRQMLLAMATGTGKTVTMVNQVYRLMKSGAGRRILFLVDRRALAAQAVRTFASFEPEPGLKFDKLYEVYSQRFQRDDADEGFNPTVLPRSYLETPQPGHAFVYVSTIQRMAINLFGRDAMLDPGDEPADDDADRLRIPISAFDVVIADECHRGYTTAELSVWRNTLDHFDAVKIGLTATPAAHTKAYFRDVVYRYEYARAVREGYLVDYDAVAVRSDVRLNGIFLNEGEEVGVVDPVSGAERMDVLEDERQFDTGEIEARITSPDSNRKIIDELKRYADAHAATYGRFPKTLIFAVNDLPHTSHADQLVDSARDVFGRGDSFVQKITGRVDRPLQRIREFRNRQEPGIVVTVDLLTTGVDIPDLEFIVFLRPVKSRILFEQMLGRGTRKGERLPDKSHFTVFDCFDGTLLEYFRQTTGITAEPPVQPSRSTAEVIEDIWRGQERDYNTRVLAKRLQRIAKEMAPGAGRDAFAGCGVPHGDLARFAADLPTRLLQDFTGTMTLLRSDAFKGLLVSYPRPPRIFLVAYQAEDTVTSEWRARGSDGREYKPADYLQAFAEFVRANPAQVDAIGILLGRPQAWNPRALSDLQRTLRERPERFTVEQLQKAHQVNYGKALADIISMVQHAADERRPLFNAQERVNLVIAQLKQRHTFSADQEVWLDRIREHLVANLSVDQEDFDTVPVLSRSGGWGNANRAFTGRLPELLQEMNEAIAA